MTFEQQIRAIEYPPGEDAALMDKAAEIASEADAFRATVADALRELRASVAAERSALFAPVLAEIDATIAKLGLGDQGEERKCS